MDCVPKTLGEIVSAGVVYWDTRDTTLVEAQNKEDEEELKEKKTKALSGTKKGSNGTKKENTSKTSVDGPSSSTGDRGISGGGKNDEVEIVRDWYKDDLKGKEADVQSFDWKYF